jgi:hypothetical protein
MLFFFCGFSAVRTFLTRWSDKPNCDKKLKKTKKDSLYALSKELCGKFGSKQRDMLLLKNYVESLLLMVQNYDGNKFFYILQVSIIFGIQTWKESFYILKKKY